MFSTLFVTPLVRQEHSNTHCTPMISKYNFHTLFTHTFMAHKCTLDKHFYHQLRHSHSRNPFPTPLVAHTPSKHTFYNIHIAAKIRIPHRSQHTYFRKNTFNIICHSFATFLTRFGEKDFPVTFYSVTSKVDLKLEHEGTRVRRRPYPAPERQIQYYIEAGLSNYAKARFWPFLQAIGFPGCKVLLRSWTSSHLCFTYRLHPEMLFVVLQCSSNECVAVRLLDSKNLGNTAGMVCPLSCAIPNTARVVQPPCPCLLWSPHHKQCQICCAMGIALRAWPPQKMFERS